MWDLLTLVFGPIIDVCLQHSLRDGASPDDRRVGIGCVLVLLTIFAAICLIVFLTRQ